MAIPACTLLHYLNLEWTARCLLLSSSLQLSEVSDLWFLLCHLTKLQHGAAQRSLTIWQIWAPPLYPKETGFWLHGHLNWHAKADAQTERKWKREWALHLRAVGEEFEQCLPRGVIFYSLCPSVAWPGALGLTVSALNTADTDSSELQHTWDEGRGVKRGRTRQKWEGRVSGRHLKQPCVHDTDFTFSSACARPLCSCVCWLGRQVWEQTLQFNFSFTPPAAFPCFYIYIEEEECEPQARRIRILSNQCVTSFWQSFFPPYRRPAQFFLVSRR